MSKGVVFQSVGTKESLVNQVVANIQQLVADGRLMPGMKLPPERELAERFGVSRTVLREAVRILVAKGLLETRHGVGTVVRQMTSDQFLEPLNFLLQTYDISIDQLHHVRSILEVGIVRVAALAATAADLAELERIVNDMESTLGDIERFVQLDDEFHRQLAQATHNPLLAILAESIGSIMHEVRVQVHHFTMIYATTIPDHRQIVAGLAAADPEVAAQAMQRHVDHARQFQQEYVAQEQQKKERCA